MIPLGTETDRGVEMTDEEQPQDPGSTDSTGNESSTGNIEANVKSKSTWLRLVFMLIIGVCYFITRVVFLPVVIFQFVWVLVTGETNKHLQSLSQWLASYTYQMMIYLAFNTEEKPFPFDSPAATTAPADG